MKIFNKKKFYIKNKLKKVSKINNPWCRNLKFLKKPCQLTSKLNNLRKIKYLNNKKSKNNYQKKILTFPIIHSLYV